jgi:hypothetical protein
MSHRSCSYILTSAFIALMVSPASAQLRDIPEIRLPDIPAPVTTLPSLPSTNLNTLNSTPTYSAPTPEITAVPAPTPAPMTAPEPVQAIAPVTTPTTVPDTTDASVTAPAPDTIPAASQEPAPPVSDESTATMTTSESPPEPSSAPQGPLLSATGRSGDGGNECDMSEAARETCNGPACLLSCLSDACPNQTNEACEFVIDCAKEITADLVSDDKQCEDETIERTNVSNANGYFGVNIVHLKVGERCKPPPCMK